VGLGASAAWPGPHTMALAAPPCRASVFIATSADGFIAKEDGSVAWLDEANATAPAGEDFGFAALMASVDALVMGRKTFETVRGIVESGAAQWPYGDTPVRVWTGSPGSVSIPASLAGKVEVVTGSPPEVLASLASGLGAKDVYVDGGQTIRAFLAAGLVGRAVITTVPVTLGAGIPLFESAGQRSELLEEAGAAKRYENGFVQTTYVARATPQGP